MTKSKKILKKDRLAFEKAMNAYIDAHCILKPRRVASDSVIDCRYLKTKYGIDYEVRHIDADGTLYNLMGAFEGGKDEYARLRDDGIDCNPFTGKWNFHLLCDTPQEAIDHITRWLGIIMNETPTLERKN